ncbi:hypothetical protein [Nesterenkonia muleiensis]|uniref:hypothetical protein n=1 Tax=Nesterenkonia muleiensis TaxID=2282648 RepID=UPI001EE3BEEC|nr:hypothetical protein [Nesterenkonia muleiensis]
MSIRLRGRDPGSGRAHPAPNRPVRDHSVAAAWGFAEATFFFVVPDVWTSWVGLRKPKRALGTTVSALGGALAGGAVTYAWGRHASASSSRTALTRVPGITDGMISEVEREVADSGHASLMRGPTRGVPYKIYARASGLQGKSLLNFLAWSVPGRLVRFVLVTLVASGVAAGVRRLFPRIPEKLISGIFWGCWTAFYAWFIPTVARRR